MSDRISALPYRPCVGIVLFNDAGHVFLGERMEHEGSWQLPQGGIEEGESTKEAFFRETKEEIGTESVEIIRIHDEKFRYEFPDFVQHKLYNGRYRGQEQIWVAARFTGTEIDIDIYAHTFPEFRAWKWISLMDVLDTITPFKRPTYEGIVAAFTDIPEMITG